MELKIAMIKLLQNFKISKCDQTEVFITFSCIINAVIGLMSNIGPP